MNLVPPHNFLAIASLYLVHVPDNLWQAKHGNACDRVRLPLREKPVATDIDNIDEGLLPALCKTLKISQHADFSVGYFNLRGWRCIDDLIDAWAGGDGACCRL